MSLEGRGPQQDLRDLDSKYAFEQYKIMWNLLESELKRFWIGFHSLSTITMVITSVLLGHIRAETLNKSPINSDPIVLAGIAAICLLSIINITINLRAQNVYITLLKSIRFIECRDFDSEDDNKKSQLLWIASEDNNKKSQLLWIARVVNKTAFEVIRDDKPYAMHLANILPIVILNGAIIGTMYVIIP